MEVALSREGRTPGPLLLFAGILIMRQDDGHRELCSPGGRKNLFPVSV